MRRPAVVIFCALVTNLFPALATMQSDGVSALLTRAERSNFTETSRYADVIEFVGGIQRLDPAVQVETFALTNDGKELPLVILGRPAVRAPGEAARSAKPIVFVMANIHAGEVEGKEAAQHIIRDVVTGPLRPLLDRIVLLVAPIYNADGNDRIDINHRSEQNGPAGGVGTRENAQGLDLNRDYMKVESPEARGLLANVFNRWDPHVIIDLHTTNGSHHGYALTYATSLNPNTDKRLLAFARDALLPEVTTTLRADFNYRAYFYGNFSAPGAARSPSSSENPTAWATFDHRPRFGNNYAGLRNRIAILSEAYSYLDFRRRVDVTEKFVRVVLRYVADRANEVLRLVKEADLTAAATGTTVGNEEGFGIAFQLKPSPKPVEILAGSVTRVIDPRNNRPRLQATDETRTVMVTEYGEFQATRRIKPPAAYVLRPEHRKIAEILQTHGIVVEVSGGAASFDVERYQIREMTRSTRAFQGHRETRLKVERVEGREDFPPGSFIVSTRQPKAALAFYLLEPESDDGLANWNLFDEAAEKSHVYPVYRAKREPALPRRIMMN